MFSYIAGGEKNSTTDAPVFVSKTDSESKPYAFKVWQRSSKPCHNGVASPIKQSTRTKSD